MCWRVTGLLTVPAASAHPYRAPGTDSWSFQKWGINPLHGQCSITDATLAVKHACSRKLGLRRACCQARRGVQVLEIARRLASSGPEGLAALRDAGMLQACLFIIESAAPGSHNAKCAVNLVGRSAEWDESSRYGMRSCTDTVIQHPCPALKVTCITLHLQARAAALSNIHLLMRLLHSHSH